MRVIYKEILILYLTQNNTKCIIKKILARENGTYYIEGSYLTTFVEEKVRHESNLQD